MSAATSLDDCLRIADEYGFTVGPDVFTDRADGGLSDAELELVSGGTMLMHPTMSGFCVTNGDFCTFNPYACS